jgi:uncharacterized protein
MKEKLSSYQYIISLAIIISAVVVAVGFKNIKPTDHAFVVTGSAVMRVSSDVAKINGSISHTVPLTDLQKGYAKVATDIAVVKNNIKSYGITDDEIIILAPTAYEQNSYNQNGEVTSQNYYVSQRLTVSTNNVDAITKFGNNISNLAEKGIFFQNSGPEYYYSKLPEARVSLLGQAVKDAKARAESIANNANSKVGSLQSVSVGIVQVLAPNSTDISDYGSYDTSTIEKDIMVTVKAEFDIN